LQDRLAVAAGQASRRGSIGLATNLRG
jgi:hypothetical protein